MIKISIIIAAYNIERYIEKCISSLINQTFSNIEIVVVNDGSTDNTLDIISNLAKKDLRIKVINKKNEGLIEARRTGYENASGDYLIFIDGDDWLDIKACELVHKQIKEHSYDIVNYTYFTAYENGKNIKSEIKSQRLNESEFLRELLLINIKPCIWSKAIKRKFLEENNITFPKGVTYGEDLAMSIKMACNKPSVITINEPLYYYFQRNGSITNSKLTEQALDIIKVLDYGKEYMKNRGMYNLFVEEYEYLSYRNLFYSFVIAKNDINDIHKEIYIKWKEINRNLSSNKYIREHRRNMSTKERIKMNLFDFNYEVGAYYVKFRNLLKKIN